jgi:A/G-specific adenine glycosylase
VLVSEVMLQQTQADRVVGSYHAFLAAFPTATDCARAGPAAVIRLWSGLGYNRRALNLHRAAQAIASDHGGLVPDDLMSLRALPGIGPYTARAVLAFAYEADVAPVDTNVLRILARCVSGAPLTPGAAQAMADRLIPPGRSWDFNQTLFDLGATVCTAGAPACTRCPLNRLCRWRTAGPGEPDPWRASPSVRPQSAFAGSDRQGRGRLLDALRVGPLTEDVLPAACGWPDDTERAARISGALISEGFAAWSSGRPPLLRLR